MPVPASEAIASDVGHGRFGLRAGLRPFEELLEETAGQRHVWAELRPVKFLKATWTAGASSTYRHDLSESHDGVLLWPRGVVTDQETLTPVDSLANCEATAGTFWYDVANGRLWVHLLNNVNPATRNLVAQLGMPIGSHAVFQPLLGAQRLLNRGLEAWTATIPDNFSVAGSGSGVTLDKTTDAHKGTYAARFTATAAASGDYRYIRQELPQATPAATGERYRFSGAYRVSSSAGSLVLRLFVEDGSSSVEADGVSVIGSVTHFAELGDTGGDWRRFSFDFLAPSFVGALAVQLRAHVAAGSTSGTVDLDDLRLEHAPRLAYHYPMLGLEGVPQVEAARADSFFGQISTGLGTLTLLNGGGFWESLFASLDWINAEVVIRLGGRFPEGGDEVPLEDCPIYIRGRVAHPTIEDSRVVLELDDQRNLTHERLPLTTFDSDTYPKLKPRDHGRPRALMLGMSDASFSPIGGMRPTQIDETGVRFGIYETCDPSYTSAGDSGENVYAYVDEQSADKEDPTKRVLLIPSASLGGPDYSKDGTGKGRITILQHVTPVVITERNRTIDFDVGGGELSISLGYGNWRLPYLLETVESAMNSAAGTADITVTYNLSTHKVMFAKAAGTLNLRTATGTNRDISFWPELGFDVGGSDRTGGGPYASDNPLFTNTDQHVIRYDETLGVCDDAAGTYTGTAFKWLSYASEIVHYMLGAVFKLPNEEIDVGSFVAARDDQRRRQSAFYLSPQDDPITFGELLERIETAANADIRIIDGRWTWVWRSSVAEADVVDLVEPDYFAFSGSYDERDLHEIVVVGLSPNPITGRYRTAQKTDSAVRVRYGQKGERTFFTTLHNLGDVTGPSRPRLVELLNEAQTKRRRFRFSVKGKTLLRPVGSQIRLTRAKGLDSSGALDQVLCRIIRKRDDVLRWRSDIEAVEIPLFKDFWILGVAGHTELGVTTKLSH